MSSELKLLFQSWIENNKGLIKDSSISENEFEVILTIKPQKNGASQADLRASKNTNEVDIGAGAYYSVSDFSYKKKEELIEILDAIRDGKVEETIYSFCGIKLKIEGRIETKNTTIFTKNIRLLGLGFLLPKSIDKLTYGSWLN